MDVTAVYVHPKFNKTLANKRITGCLSEVSTLHFGVDNITPLPINTDRYFPFLGQRTEALGWGATNIGGDSYDNGTYPDVPQITTLRMNNNYDCERYWPLKKNTRDNVGCVLGVSMPVGYRTAVCVGDSGGPVVAYGKMWGITSFGPTNCGDMNAPAVVTRVSSVAPWICKTLEKVNAEAHKH
ncbi:trypsin-like serine protease [Gonapodya prolifera JEL478]|uniref:Trypsin-like serine protease n=1 Tax=Gonapodya prolifera (strain JEL478) TaxID=1344416 RepID=A0A139ANJ1_GONPJ|nr:trypsin-like serine protease [Gonapodya prolifera JEL478]|eukprot:KXS18306.1 trypsin-like serine protease [Gonapodya prolifera JEL478]